MEGFRQRGSKKASKKAPSRTKVRVRQKNKALILPRVPESIEVVYPNEGASGGFYDAWDAEAFYVWAEEAKKAIAKAVPLKEVESLWRSIPSEEMAVVDGDRYPVITYADGETFIVDVEDALKKALKRSPPSSASRYQVKPLAEVYGKPHYGIYDTVKGRFTDNMIEGIKDSFINQTHAERIEEKLNQGKPVTRKMLEYGGEDAPRPKSVKSARRS